MAQMPSCSGRAGALSTLPPYEVWGKYGRRPGWGPAPAHRLVSMLQCEPAPFVRFAATSPTRASRVGGQILRRRFTTRLVAHRQPGGGQHHGHGDQVGGSDLLAVPD